MSTRRQSYAEVYGETRSQLNTFARQVEDGLAGVRFPMTVDLEGLRWSATITIEGRGEALRPVDDAVVVEIAEPEQEEPKPKTRARRSPAASVQNTLMD